MQRKIRSLNQSVSPKNLQDQRKSGKTPRSKIITNIHGNINDKMKLTSRLNAAVDELIKVGQKYKKRHEVVNKNIE